MKMVKSRLRRIQNYPGDRKIATCFIRSVRGMKVYCTSRVLITFCENDDFEWIRKGETREKNTEDTIAARAAARYLPLSTFLASVPLISYDIVLRGENCAAVFCSSDIHGINKNKTAATTYRYRQPL